MTKITATVQETADMDTPEVCPPGEDRRESAEEKALPEGVQILEPGYEAREDLSNLRVLIVDDNRFHRSLIRNALASQGMHAQWEAEDAKAAETLLADQAMDLIIMDNNMPGEKGIVFTRRIRMGETAGNRFTPIVMVTAYGDEKIIRAARDAGVHEYVLKPFNIMALIKRVQLTFKTPRDFIIAPGYVGPDRRWKQKLKEQKANSNKASDNTDARVNVGNLPPGLCKPEVLVFD